MSFCRDIGGYFGLELPPLKNYTKEAVLLNSARSCLRYVIKAFDIKEIYLPYYTCPVVWQTVQKEKCKIKFYHIDKNFYPLTEFPQKAFVLYTNYFGVCARNVKKLAAKYQNLIIDNAHAFYMPKYGIASFNSIRKFFGVPDGACLYSDKILENEFEKATSYQRFSHLLKRIDVNAEFGYSDFCLNDEALCDEDIKYMSNLTNAIFNSCDIEFAKVKRLENFNFLDSALSKTNELDLKLESDDVPMVYPYLIEDKNLKQKLIKNKIYIATYWSPMPEEYQEGLFQKYLIPLPIDQRYDKDDLGRVLEVING